MSETPGCDVPGHPQNYAHDCEEWTDVTLALEPKRRPQGWLGKFIDGLRRQR